MKRVQHLDTRAFEIPAIPGHQGQPVSEGRGGYQLVDGVLGVGNAQFAPHLGFRPSEVQEMGVRQDLDIWSATVTC